MKSYPLDSFDKIPSRKVAIKEKVDSQDIPPVESVKTDARWTDDMLETFESEKEDIKDRSSSMSWMAYSGAEMGWSDGQILSVLYALDEKWQKYISRRPETRENILLNFVNRAREKIGYSQIDIDPSNLLRDPGVPVIDSEEKPDPTVWGFKSFIDADFHIDWMLEGLLAQEGIGLITASPGSGKTQFSIQLGMYLALGSPQFLHWNNVVGARKVLFLSLEMSAPPLHHFMSQISKGYENIKQLEKNFKIDPLGKPLALDTKPGQAYLNNLLDSQKPDLIIIDSLQRAVSKEMTDEISAKRFMHYLAGVRAKHKCAVVIIHHNRKRSAEAKRNDLTTLDDVYGSVFYTADVDFALGINKLTPDTVSIHSLKNRLGRELSPFELIRDETLHFSLEIDSLEGRFGTEGRLDV